MNEIKQKQQQEPTEITREADELVNALRDELTQLAQQGVSEETLYSFAKQLNPGEYVKIANFQEAAVTRIVELETIARALCTSRWQYAPEFLTAIAKNATIQKGQPLSQTIKDTVHDWVLQTGFVGLPLDAIIDWKSMSSAPARTIQTYLSENPDKLSEREVFRALELTREWFAGGDLPTSSYMNIPLGPTHHPQDYRYYARHATFIARTLQKPDGSSQLDLVVGECISKPGTSLQQAMRNIDYIDRAPVPTDSTLFYKPEPRPQDLVYSEETWRKQATAAGFSGETAIERAAMLYRHGLSDQEVHSIVEMNRLSTSSLSWALNTLARTNQPIDREHIVGYAMTREICEEGAASASTIGPWPRVSDFHNASCIMHAGKNGKRLLVWLQAGLQNKSLSQDDVSEALAAALDYHPVSVLTALKGDAHGESLLTEAKLGLKHLSSKVQEQWDIERTLLNFRTQQFREGKRRV